MLLLLPLFLPLEQMAESPILIQRAVLSMMRKESFILFEDGEDGVDHY